MIVFNFVESEDLLYQSCERIISLYPKVISSINELLEWQCNLESFSDGIITLFQTIYCYDYCEDDYKILVYQKNGKIKYYDNLIDFYRDYGLLA